MLIPEPKALFAGQITFAEVLEGIDYKEFPGVAEELYNEIETIIAGASDGAVSFTPKDPALQDPGEAGWTLGHVIVHLTAGLEELSAMAAMQARGVSPEGRLRYEIPWETVTTAAQVNHRMTESRRIVKAFFGGWPDEPHFETTRVAIPQLGPMNCNATFMLGLMHTKGHLEQLREIMGQAKSL